MGTKASPANGKTILVKKLKILAEDLRNRGYPNGGATANEELSRLMNEYNHIVDEIHILEEKPRFDPLDALPLEVCTAIFTHYITESRYDFWVLSPQKALYLGLVSPKWRRFIQSTPLFWTDIVLDNEARDLAMKIRMSLTLSGSAPLMVVVVGPFLHWKIIEPILLTYKQRIREIGLFSITYPGIANLFHPALSHLSTPQLRHIYIKAHYLEKSEVEGLLMRNSDAPIRRISIHLSKNALQLPFIRNLRELITYEDANHVLEIAEDLPLLREVKFLLPLSFFPNWVGVNDEGNERPFNLAPLKWTLLEYSQNSTETLNSLLVRLPSLDNLTVASQYDSLSQTMSSMGNLQSLYSLCIRVEGLPTKKFISPVIKTPLETVRKFKLTGISFNVHQINTRTMHVPASFFCLLPNVEVLEICGIMSPLVCAILSPNGFQKINTLVLDINVVVYPNPGDRTPTAMLSDNIKTLRVKIDNDHLQGICARMIENLTIEVFGAKELTPGRHPEHGWCTVKYLHASQFSATVYDCESLSSLTTLSIAGHWRNDVESEDITRFCIIIATSPSTCPALHTLSFGRIPDLDILLIMLERRNLASHENRARIRRLELPNQLSQSNMKIIHDLVCGRIVARQSNYEASLYSRINDLLRSYM